MKKKLFFWVLVLLIAGTSSLGAQEDSQGTYGDNSPDINSQGPIDESTVAGNGSQPAQNNTGFNVNTFTGDAFATITDFSYHRNGFSMKYERYFHNGISSTFGELGPNWTSNYDICLFVPIPNTGGNTAQFSFAHQTWNFSSSDGGNTWQPQPGCFYQLQNVNSGGVTYQITDKYGNNYTFAVLISLGGAPNVAYLIGMNDLNQNSVTLTYQSFTYDYVTYGAGNLIPAGTYGESGVRLSTVSGNNNNWSVTLTYYDNPAPVSVVSSSPYVAVWYNFYGSQIAQVTNSAGDTIVFNTTPANYSIPPSVPVSQVTRNPSGLNGSYQYYSYSYLPPNTPLNSNPTTITTLKQIQEAMAPAGYRNINYVSESNPSNFNNPVRQIQNGLGQVMYTYDYSIDGSGNHVTNTSGPNGLMEMDVYDSSSRMIQKRFPIDGHTYTQFYTWNSNNLCVNFVDGNGHAVTMAYDPLGNMTYNQDPVGYKIISDYNNISRLTARTDKNQTLRTYNYDAYGNLTQINEPGRTTSYTYDSYGNKATKTDGNHHTTYYSYDGNGSPTTLITPPSSGSPVTTSFQYDARGKLTSQTDPLGQTTTFTYQNDNWLSEIFYPDRTNEQYQYNSAGDLTFVQDRNGTQAKYAFDGDDHLTDSYQAYGTANVKHTQTKFDAIGNKLSINDNNNHLTTFINNEQNLTRTIMDSMGKGFTNNYDGVEDLQTTKDSRGTIQTFNYYPDNQLMSVKFNDGTPTISYTYDGNGNILSMSDGIGIKNYTYDSLNNLLTTQDVARNFTTAYTYDSLGQILSEKNNKITGTINFNYYFDNSRASVTDIDGTATSYTYNALGQPVSISYPNGASVIYTYLPTNHRLKSLTNVNSHGETLSSFSYVYDNVGNIENMTDLTGTTNYSHDYLYQLTGETFPGPLGTTSYSYDGVGNRKTLTQNGSSQSLAYDIGNEINNGYGESFTYDQAGNMINRISSAGTTQYSWDALNHLVKVASSSGSITLVYDGNNRRIQKETPQATINYFYGAGGVLVETDASGNVLKSYNPGIRYTDKQGNKFFYVYNGHGDVCGLMDSNQNIVQSYSYDAFGKTLGDQEDTNNYRYAGSGFVYSDNDMGLQYMWHRWYDPKLGRFISRDPIGFSSGGTNFYEYLNNNPIQSQDADGLGMPPQIPASRIWV